jgi:hypothetical protein
MERNDFTNRRVTNIETVLGEEEMGIIHLDFVTAIRASIHLFRCPPALIINMDETPIYYDPEVKSTFAAKGSKVVSIKKSSTTSKATALLAVSISGEKLTPLLVLIAKAMDGKVKKELLTYDKRSVYDLGPKGFCDTRIMIQWVDKCLRPYVISHGGGKGSGQMSILMMDNFKAHLTKETRLAIIGCRF